MADYNAKIMSLLGTDTVPEPTINRSNTYEQFYTVTGRTINCPVEMANSAGVTEDTCAEVLRFRVPRFWDGNDLAQHVGKILFINAAGESDEHQILEAEVSDTCISFDWCLDSRVTKAAGNVNFAIRFESIDTDKEEILFRWTTLPCTLKVSAGLVWSDEKIEAEYPSILEQWLQRMTDIEANVNGSLINIGDAISAANSAAESAAQAASDAIKSVTAANDAVTAANKAVEDASSATTAANNVINAVSETKDSALTNMSATKDSAIANISATKDAAITNISETKDAAIAEISAAAEATSKAEAAAEAANTAAAAANEAAGRALEAIEMINKILEDINGGDSSGGGSSAGGDSVSGTVDTTMSYSGKTWVIETREDIREGDTEIVAGPSDLPVSNKFAVGNTLAATYMDAGGTMHDNTVILDGATTSLEGYTISDINTSTGKVTLTKGSNTIIIIAVPPIGVG